MVGEFLKWGLLGAMFCGSVYGHGGPSHTHNATTVEEAEQFTIERGLVNEIFDASIEEKASYGATGVELGASFSMMSPDRLALKNDYFVIPYQEGLSSLPGIEVAARFSLMRETSYGINGGFAVGYGYVEGRYSAITAKGTVLEDVLRLHRIPITAFAEPFYNIPGFPWVRPALVMGVGAQWLYQTGTLDGISQGFWVPFYRVGPRLTLFPARSGASTFQGISLTALYASRLTGDQEFRAIEYQAEAAFSL